MKNIVFGGCSLTWGQSLWYEGDFPNDNHPRDGMFYGNMICEECMEYMIQNRWPKKVASYFGKQEKVNAINGGNNMGIKAFIQNNIDEDTELVIFQTTQFVRYPEYVDYQVEKIEEFVEKTESMGIPVRFIHWMWTDITEEEMKIFLGNKKYDAHANRLKFPPGGKNAQNGLEEVPKVQFQLPPHDGNRLTSKIVRDRTIPILGKFNFSDIVEWDVYKNGNELNRKYTIAGKFGIPENSSAADTHFNLEAHNMIANEIIKHIENELKNGTLKF